MPGIIRPRLTDHFGIMASQENLDFVIPFLSEDLPLYLDPFLLWRSPSQQDQSLHQALVASFNIWGTQFRKGKQEKAISDLIRISECDEVGFGTSRTRTGKRIGPKKATEILSLFELLPHYEKGECQHMEEIQLYVDGISKDRISDFACNFLKSFLIDFTMEECERISLPLTDVEVPNVFSLRDREFSESKKAKLPINPEKNAPIIFVPKRWLRFVPWINYEDYFKISCPQDDIAHEGELLDRVRVLNFNRENYGQVENYVRAKERSFDDCHNDPLFHQIPVLSAKRHLQALKKLPSGRENGADKIFERLHEQVLPSLLYPHLDFATAQSRTDSGVSIRDLVFYNNQDHEFLKGLYEEFGARQIVMEMKNVEKVSRTDIDQLNRYLPPDLGQFGVIVTRNELPRPRLQQTVDLWSGQRKAIIALSDQDIEVMVEVFESRQRLPLDVLRKKFFEFRQKCPV